MNEGDQPMSTTRFAVDLGPNAVIVGSASATH